MLQVISVPEVCFQAILYKNLVTKQYMMQFGIQSTRDGSYPYKNINTNALFFLEKKKEDAEEKYFHCGLTGHFTDACPNHVNIVKNTNDAKE